MNSKARVDAGIGTDKGCEAPTPRTSIPRTQRGQALIETVLACSIFMVLMMGMQWMWRMSEAQQVHAEAVRFAAWERTAYSSDAGKEMQAVFAGDGELASLVFRYIYMTPLGRRAMAQGGRENETLVAHRDWYNGAVRFLTSVTPQTTFAQVLGNALNTLTDSSGLPGGPHGFEPTGGTVTSLKLDQQIMQTVRVTAHTSLDNLIESYLERRFGIVPPETAINPALRARRQTNLGSLTLVTNPWSAPAPVAIKRVYKELNPLDPGNPVGMVVNNNRAFNFSAFIGSMAGFAGNYRVDKAGLDPRTLSSWVAGNFNPSSFSSWDGAATALHSPTNAFREELKLVPELMEPKYVSIRCEPRVDDETRKTQYTHDPLCPNEQMRARVISLDNPALRYYK